MRAVAPPVSSIIWSSRSRQPSSTSFCEKRPRVCLVMKNKKPRGGDLVLNAIEREHKKLGELLHETLCQTLAGISIQADVMAARLSKGEPVGVTDLAELTIHIHE